ncbi:MAG: PAS domain-containing protein [Candidatus Omnitrophica bacterium]|nr:PAS domain-containing protein [Candidatus Omnitrophota bacterium]
MKKETMGQSEERYRALFNFLIEGFCIIEMIFDDDGKPVDYRFLEVNPAFEEQTGLHGAEGKLMREIAPEHEAFWFETYGKIALTGEPAQFEHEAKALNRWFEVRAFRMGKADNREVAICFKDITKRKHSEAGMLENTRLLQDVIDGSNSPIFLKDVEGKFITINASLESMLGMSREEIKGKTDYDIASKEVADYWRAHDKQVLATGKAIQIEEKADLKDGHHVFLANKFPLMDATGKIYGIGAISHDITDRKRAEEAFQENMERLDLALISSGMATFDWDILNNKRVWSEGVHRLMGTKSEDFTGSADEFFRIIHPEDKSIVQASLARAVETGDYETAYRAVWPDSSIHHIASRGKVHRDNTGRAVSMTGLCWDVTEQKRIEEVLRENDKELRKLNRTLKALSDSNQAIMRADNENDYLNEVCQNIIQECGHAMVWVGFAEQDEAKTVRPVAQAGFEEGYLKTVNITWDETDRGRGPTGTAIRTGQLCICRNMLTDPDFEPWRQEAVKRGYASSIVFPLMAYGSAFGAIMIYSKDPDPFSEKEVQLLSELANDLAYGITSIRLRVERDKIEEELKRERKVLHTFINNIPDYVYCKDTQSKFIIANISTARAMKCQSPEDLVGKTDFDFYPKKLADKYFADEQEIIRTSLPKMGMEEELVDQNADIRILLTSKVPLLDNAGLVIGLVGIGRDITQQKLAEDILKRDKETFEKLVQERTQDLIETQMELDRAKRLSDIGTLAATVAHELRNPLAAIAMAAANIQRKIKGAVSFERHFHTIEKKITQSDLIINNLLFYSRLRKPSLQNIEIHSILEECVDLAEKQHNGKIVFERRFDPIKNIVIEADVLQMHEIFSNLLNNACDAIVDVMGRIEITTKHDEAFVKIYIKDNGEGISKENLKQIFEPFFTTKAKGTGLGLTVCYQVMKMHGGTIGFTSEPGQGTVVEIVLPKKHHS